jgi:hypothetical protein
MTMMEMVADPDGYQPGACNIGPAEIAARRRAGHTGVIAAGALLVVLIALDAPAWSRIAVALPAAVAASGYLQAAMRFCAAYGWAGVFNLSRDLRATRSVAEAAARRADRRKALEIGALSGLIGTAVGVAAALLPI